MHRAVAAAGIDIIAVVAAEAGIDTIKAAAMVVEEGVEGRKDDHHGNNANLIRLILI